MMHPRDIAPAQARDHSEITRPQITNLWCDVNESYPDMREHVSGAERILRGFQAIAAVAAFGGLALLIIHAVVTTTCASCGL